jgi:energy-coupling factor transport system permease protein
VTASQPLRASAVWIWAILFATAVLRTDNPLLLSIEFAVTLFVVSERALVHTRWALAFKAILALSAAVLISRLVVLAAIPPPAIGQRLWTLPTWEPIGGFRLGGPLSLASFVAALYDSYRIFVTVAVVGAASSMSSVSDALRSLPAAVYDVGVAVAIGVAVAPLGASALVRQQRTRRLRGRPRIRPRDWRRIIVPVLDETLDRSIGLAETLDARGYGRVAGGRVATASTAVLWAALALIGYGTYEVGAGTRRAVGWATLLFGGAIVTMSLRSAGGHRRSRYEPIGSQGGHRWTINEWITAAGAVLCLALSIAQGSIDPTSMELRYDPLRIPPLPILAAIGALAAAAPALRVRTAATPPALDPAPPTLDRQGAALAARRWRTT